MSSSFLFFQKELGFIAPRMLYMLWKFHNRSAFCPEFVALIRSAHTTAESQQLNNSFRHAKSKRLPPPVHLSDGISLGLHKTKKKRKILHKYLNKAELCLACNSPPNTHPLTHTHLLILHTVLPPYAKNYHTGISLYPYLNIAEKNWAFIWKRGCVFIQQCQHQERRETPHCCWCKQERVRDWRPGRRNEWRLTERRKKKPFERQ